MKQKIMAVLMTLIMSLSIMAMPASAACRTYSNCTKCGGTSISRRYVDRVNCKKKSKKNWRTGKRETYWQEHVDFYYKCGEPKKKFFFFNGTCGKKYKYDCETVTHSTKGQHVYDDGSWYY